MIHWKKDTKSKWEAACRAWSRDDMKDALKTMKLGEDMMFAATDYICALEDALENKNGPEGPSVS